MGYNDSSTEDLPFHRKYRPTTLMGYIGNEKLKVTAMSVLRRQEKRPQVILLYGDSGCGKTTFARLLVKEYKCEDRDLETGACGQCANCRDVDEYITTSRTDNLINVNEINIGDNSGKRDLDAIVADMETPTFGDDWKIYIFDEVHAASEGLQNRLLKTAEEPPENVLMILCTTNPERLLPTLRNRCQLQLHVHKPKLNELVGLLKSVCIKEGADYDIEGLKFIANRSEFTIRDALQNLWQVVTEQGGATYEKATRVFEEVSNKLVAEVFNALFRKDTLRYVTLICDIKSKMDLSVFLNSMRVFVRNGICIINGVQVDGVSDGEVAVYRDLFGSLGVEQVACMLNKLLSLNTNNLEMELLLLGYTGFDENQHKKEESVLDKEVLSLEKELAKEVGIADAVMREREQETFNVGVDNAKKQMGSISVDTLISMGAALVEE